MYQSELASIAHAEAMRAYQAQYGHPMKGYTSPEQVDMARANALYYNARPGGMRGSRFEDQPGALTDNIIGQTLGELGEAFDQKTLMYTAAGAIAGMYLVGGHNVKSAGMGAVAGFLLSKVF
jgi:hypothetical protein